MCALFLWVARVCYNVVDATCDWFAQGRVSYLRNVFMSKEHTSKRATHKEEVKESAEVAAKETAVAGAVDENHPTGCCGGTCSVHTPKRVVAYRDERFLFGFVSGLAIAAMAGFIILLNAGVLGARDGAGARGAAAAQGTPQKQQLPTLTKNEWVYGNPKAKVTIVEFADIDCPFCKKFHKTAKDIVDESKGRVKWVFRHAPLDSLHPQARTKANMLECIAAQTDNDTFWRALDQLETGEVALASKDDYLAFAESHGADKEKFDTCMADGTYQDKVARHLDEAQRLGMKGTPFSVIVAGKTAVPVPGALPKDKVEALIAPLLK